jgi:hypothetical protein
MTVSSFTPTSRPVLRIPTPSCTWARIDTTFAGGSGERKKAVPLRSEKRALQLRQYSNRYCRCLPMRSHTLRFPAPRLPRSGHDGLRQQNRDRSFPAGSSMTASSYRPPASPMNVSYGTQPASLVQ